MFRIFQWRLLSCQLFVQALTSRSFVQVTQRREARFRGPLAEMSARFKEKKDNLRGPPLAGCSTPIRQPRAEAQPPASAGRPFSFVKPQQPSSLLSVYSKETAEQRRADPSPTSFVSLPGMRVDVLRPTGTPLRQVTSQIAKEAREEVGSADRGPAGAGQAVDWARPPASKPVSQVLGDLHFLISYVQILLLTVS